MTTQVNLVHTFNIFEVSFYNLLSVGITFPCHPYPLTFVFILIIIEKASRGKSQYVNTSQKSRKLKTKKLNGMKSAYTFFWCLLFSVIGFIVPVIQLFIWLLETYDYIFNAYSIQIITNTISISAIAAAIIVLISIWWCSCY